MQWQNMAERGTATGVWSVVTLTHLLGRRRARAILRVLAAYYTASAPGARRASRRYFELLQGHPPSHRQVYEHFLRFSQCTLDRLLFVQGRTELFDVASHGEDLMWSALDQGRGAILLGAHLGSFEAMQRMADKRRLPINIVGDFRNAEMINGVLRRLNPRSTARLIELDPAGVDFVLRIRELIDAGELVAILGDRVQDPAKAASVTFLGATAQFPTGPYLLASVLKCPIYLIFSLHRGGPRRYELYCEPFAEQVRLPRGDRQAALGELAQRYAERLEHYCRLAPDNWFNFYDFWADSPV